MIALRSTGVNPGEHPEYIIVGLGNPGPRYEKTRHNVGFQMIDHLEKNSEKGVGVKRMLHSSLTGKCVLDGYCVFLVKPQTYMNNSGLAVNDVMRYYRMQAHDLIVIYDDVSLPVGQIRIRKNGSAGGHNGMKSVIEHLGTSDFIRVRIGIGAKPEGWDLANYVLGQIPETDRVLLEKAYETAREAIRCIFYYNVDKAMSLYNSRGSVNNEE